MKKLIFSLILLWAVLPLFGQGRYVVFKTTGSVSVRPAKAETWQRTEQRMTLALSDALRIGSNGQISVLDRETNHIYRSVTTGEMQVKEMIDKAREQSKQTTRLLAQELREKMSEADKAKYAYAVGGVTLRGWKRPAADTTTLLYNALTALVRRVAAGERPADSRFAVVRKLAADGTFTFAVENAADRPYIVNVLRIDAGTKRAALCFEELLALPARTKAEIPVAFAADEALYLLFAVGDGYDPATLGMMLRNGLPVQGESAAEVIAVTAE